MNQKCDIWFACIILCISCTSGNNNLTRGNEIVCDTNATEISCSITKKETKENSIEVNFFPIKNASIENALKKLDIEVSAIRKMTVHAKVRNISDEINWNIFSNFSSLRILEINFPESEIYNITEDTLDLPESVKEIAISNARIPQLSNSTNITDAIFKNGESKEAFGNCEHLNKLELMNWRVFSKEWLTNCLKLYEIRLAFVSVETIKNVLNKVESLKNLTIENCNILILGNDFLNPSLAGLKSFVFIYNQITNIHRDAFANLVQIENLDLTGNFLYNATEVRTTLMCLENLRSLILDKNRELYSCDLFKDSFLPVERLSLQHTRRIEMCFSNLTTLQYLDLRHNRISKLDLRKLPAPKNHSLLIDLRMNNITEMYGTEEEFEQITNTFIELQNITILVNNVTVDCDCNHNWVSKAFKTLVNLHVHDEVRCTNGTFITKTSPKILECDKFKCDECTCRRSWGDNTTSVDCEEASIVVVPRVKGLRELYAHRNRIERVFVEDFPHTLQYADLTNNRISSISDDVVGAIFGNTDRKLRLADNPLVCGCDSRMLIMSIHQHQDQVLDFPNITCANDGIKVQDIDIYNFCVEPYNFLLDFIITVVSIISATFIGFILYQRYKNQIQLFLFSKGFCLSCMKEQIDSRDFDAFISFCHLDDEFISNHLLPTLKNYRLIVHYRDWIAGEWIPRQIAKSIEQSRRTILVLSNNYLNSLWGMLEFRMAHAATLQEGKRRLIAIILDDIFDNPQLDAEMRNYLASNTYIKWDDPWFAEKLRFALPHYGSERPVDSGIDIDSFRAAVISYRSDSCNSRSESGTENSLLWM